MTLRVACSTAYHRPLRDGILLALLGTLFSGTVLDLGEMATICEGTLIAYGALLLLILVRRPLRPTRMDLRAVRIGFPVLYFVGVLVYPYAWHLRGVR